MMTCARLGSHGDTEARREARHEPAWLTADREQAWNAFVQLPMPGATQDRQEEWSRSDLRAFHWEQFPLSNLQTENSGTKLDPYWLRQGVLFDSLERLAWQHSDLVRSHLTAQAIDPHTDKFAALAAARWSGGTMLYVPRGVAVDQPLHTMSALGAGRADLGRTLIVLEEGAEATLLSETASTDPDALGPAVPGLHCGLTEIFLSPGSRLRYVHLQKWGHGVWHFAHQKALVGRAATLQWTTAALGSRLAKVNQQVVMMGEGATVQINGAMLAEGRQHLAYHTLQHHMAGGCRSDLLYRGVLQDQSRLVWRGMIRVDPNAQKSDGYQRNDNLVLSESARADSIPGLEIQAHDVRCTHGATVGRVDDELLFYAQTRGLSRNEASRLIVLGFFQQVLDRITIPDVSEALATAIERKVSKF